MRGRRGSGHVEEVCNGCRLRALLISPSKDRGVVPRPSLLSLSLECAEEGLSETQLSTIRVSWELDSSPICADALHALLS